jgi:hypothetical protein
MMDAAGFANLFSPILKEVTEGAAEERTTLKQECEELTEHRNRIDAEIAELEEHLNTIDEDVALGFAHAARGAGVTVGLNKGNGSKKRRRPRPSENDFKKVLAVVPDGKETAMTIGQIAKALDLPDSTVVGAALKHYMKNTTIETIGERRAKRYYRASGK